MSVSSESPLSQAIELLSEMSVKDMLSLNETLASKLCKSKGVKVSGKKVRDPDAPKRQAAVGTMAWIAFVKNCKEEDPTRFEGVKKEAEKLSICKEIRAEDPDAYNQFVEEYKAEHSVDADSDAESQVSEAKAKKAAPAKKAPAKAKKAQKEESDSEESEAEEKPAKAKKAAPKDKKSAPAPAAKGKGKKAKEADSEDDSEAKAQAVKEKLAALKAGAKAKKEKEASPFSDEESGPVPKKAAAGGGAPVKKGVKKATPAAEAKAKKSGVEVDDSFEKITIGEDIECWLDKSSNSLFEVAEDGKVGTVRIGTYQPENAEEPIKYD